MNGIKVSVDGQSFQSKPTSTEAALISSRIGGQSETLECPVSIYSFMQKVGKYGHSFSPATFVNGSKKIENFEQMQLLVLDFDGTVSYKDVRDRAKQYGIPLLSAYETLSSENQDRFRAVFLNDVSITDKMAAKIYKSALMTIFPEADKTDGDISKMYYGGKNLLYYDQSLPTIDMETTLRNMTYYLRNKYGPTHYKKHVKEFAKKHKIRLNRKGLLDVSVAENPTESEGTFDVGKISPKAIIFYKDNGEFLPTSCYQIHTEEDCTRSSVKENHSKNHSEYRSEVINGMIHKCQLFREFESGKRRLHHDELFGISTNMIHVETGISTFKDILSRYPDYYDTSKQDRWAFYLKYNKEQDYHCRECNMFCAYKDICSHGANILSTVKPKRGEMVKLSNFKEKYHSIEEVQQGLSDNLEQAICADDKRWHIIKAQTAAGKTEAFLKLMRDMDGKFLIVLPTNKLKRDVESRAQEMGINLMVTPSLDEIKDEMPDYIWEHIKFLRDTGQHSKVYLFISRMAEEENISCLEEYLEQQKEFEKHVGNTITTHRRFLNMDKKTLDKYDVVIIDEDIILSSIIPNQCEIPLSVLKKVSKRARREIAVHKKGAYAQLAQKIKRLFETVKNDTLFRLSGFEWDDGMENDGKETESEDADGILALTDIPSFCLAEHFIYRKASEEKNLPEDSVVFLKPYTFKDIKHIMVSATVDKDICEYCFGKGNVKFYECKQARYVGTLNQYFDKPVSRRYIDENPGILEKISSWSGFGHMITFKKYGIGDMYFGNAIGCDYLKGKDIDVVGTPYQVDFLYKLFPFSIGLDIDEDAVMKSCQVSHNGYMFTFTTYGEEHDVLRKFHFWMIESELEQAVGRARLLRCRCTVNLFSNFPLRQAVMKESEYDDDSM